MKTLFLNGGAILVASLMILTAVSANRQELKPVAINVTAAPIPKLHTSWIQVGASMQEYGFFKGDLITVNPDQACKPGDACAFKCLVEKCTFENGMTDSLKRLVSVENDCYWFEGNSKPWIVDGEEFESFDSRSYGCLKSNEFKMYGVAVPMRQDTP